MPTSALNDLRRARCRRRWRTGRRRARRRTRSTPNSTSFTRTMLMPLVVAAGSLDRIGGEHESRRRAFQVHDQRTPRSRTPPRRSAYISSRSVMPIPNGRGDCTPAPKFSYSLRDPHELLDQQREADGEQREVEVADAQARQRHQQPERHREHARRRGSPATTGQPGFGREPGGRERADAGEGDLAERDQAAFAGDQRVGEVDDRQRDALREHADPELVERDPKMVTLSNSNGQRDEHHAPWPAVRWHASQPARGWQRWQRRRGRRPRCAGRPRTPRAAGPWPRSCRR